MQTALPWDQNYVAIDFETAIAHHICSVGIVTVENGEIVEEFHALIQPPENEYNYYNIKVHGITPDQTINEPSFYGVYPEIKKRLQGQTVVAHNEKFDRGVLMKTMRDYSMNYDELNLSHQWECTVKIYRKLGYKKAGLAHCCAVNNIPLQHHDALSDARACAVLYRLAL